MDHLVTFSRLQFAMTALYHFIFVPLTIGLSLMLVMMEGTYVISGKQIWKDITKFWGKLFSINFAMGVATGITMEFQFGTNWSYYSHYVGDIFGVPLAIEGVMAFFLESTFLGLFLFGWDKMGKKMHLLATFLLALGTSLSALWILIANGWMQNPIGSYFNPVTMRMELSSIKDIILNPVAQTKFVHTICAGYVTGAIFVLSISAYYIIKNRELEVAKRSFTLASVFGLISVVSVIFFGDESGYVSAQRQKMKLAAIEAMWETEKAPADLIMFAIPDMQEKKNHFAIKIPKALGYIVTRSGTKEIPGIKDLEKEAAERIKLGIADYNRLVEIRNGTSKFDKSQDKFENLGHALLLKKYRKDIENATESEIQKAAESTIPNVWITFFSFRIMVGCGVVMLILCTLSFYYSIIKSNFYQKKFLLFFALLCLPLPWIASQVGWLVAECGRQPWAIDGILPTRMGASMVPVSSVIGSLLMFLVLYTFLLVVDVYLMIKYIKLGPSYLSENKK